MHGCPRQLSGLSLLGYIIRGSGIIVSRIKCLELILGFRGKRGKPISTVFGQCPI